MEMLGYALIAAMTLWLSGTRAMPMGRIDPLYGPMWVLTKRIKDYHLSYQRSNATSCIHPIGKSYIFLPWKVITSKVSRFACQNIQTKYTDGKVWLFRGIPGSGGFKGLIVFEYRLSRMARQRPFFGGIGSIDHLQNERGRGIPPDFDDVGDLLDRGDDDVMMPPPPEFDEDLPFPNRGPPKPRASGRGGAGLHWGWVRTVDMIQIRYNIYVPSDQYTVLCVTASNDNHQSVTLGDASYLDVKSP